MIHKKYQDNCDWTPFHCAALLGTNNINDAVSWRKLVSDDEMCWLVVCYEWTECWGGRVLEWRHHTTLLSTNTWSDQLSRYVMLLSLSARSHRLCRDWENTTSHPLSTTNIYTQTCLMLQNNNQSLSRKYLQIIHCSILFQHTFSTFPGHHSLKQPIHIWHFYLRHSTRVSEN